MQIFNFKSELTADGSPTLRMAPTWEPMHSLDGAFSETLYIYQPTVQFVFKARWLTPAAERDIKKTPRLLSIGLGLGYNEILVACEALKNNCPTVQVDSYESVVELRSQFKKWIFNEDCELTDVYNKIVTFFVRQYLFPKEKILEFLKHQLNNNHLNLHGAITAESVFKKSQGILFDAFSHNTSPDLWTDDFLESFFGMAADDECYFSTYASKGNLHRALKKHFFITDKKVGFAKKRESTFALRRPEK